MIILDPLNNDEVGELNLTVLATIQSIQTKMRSTMTSDSLTFTRERTPMICPYCGNDCLPRTVVCPKCGALLQKTSTRPTTKPEAKPTARLEYIKQEYPIPWYKQEMLAANPVEIKHFNKKEPLVRPLKKTKPKKNHMWWLYIIIAGMDAYLIWFVVGENSFLPEDYQLGFLVPSTILIIFATIIIICVARLVENRESNRPRGHPMLP